MKISKKDLKELVQLWIVLELAIAVYIMISLGQSGLARKFCEHFPLEECHEIDWEYYGYDDLALE